jgi:hypothetical protein
MSEAEQQFVNTSQRVRKEFEAKLEEVRRAGEEDVHLRMDAGSKRIMQQNRSLQEELRIHIEVLSLGTLLGFCASCGIRWTACGPGQTNVAPASHAQHACFDMVLKHACCTATTLPESCHGPVADHMYASVDVVCAGLSCSNLQHLPVDDQQPIDAWQSNILQFF